MSQNSDTTARATEPLVRSYKPRTQQRFWCKSCDRNVVDSADETTGRFMLAWGHTFSQANQEYDGDYLGVMFAQCTQCIPPEQSPTHTSLAHFPIIYALLRPALTGGNPAVRRHAQRLVEVLQGDERAAVQELLDRPLASEPPARVRHAGQPPNFKCVGCGWVGHVDPNAPCCPNCTPAAPQPGAEEGTT